MSETIVLPRSGVVLTQHPKVPYSRFIATAGLVEMILECVTLDHLNWDARICFPVTRTSRECVGAYGEKGECISWLDSRVLELRAALMPADARERVARAIYHADTGLCDSCLSHDGDRDDYYAQADAALAALGGGE
jgi:hypothetical protein